MGNSDKQYDVVIVGGGWAGSIIAYRLAQAQKRVLVLEAGIPIEGIITDPAQNELDTTGNRAAFMETFYKAMAKTPESPYVQNLSAPKPAVLDLVPVTPENTRRQEADMANAGYFIQKGNLPFGSTYERRGGGTSWHWLGTSLRMMPNDFKMKTVYDKAVDWPMTYDELRPYYDQAEYEIGVSADVNEQKIHGITFRDDYVYPMAKIPPTVLDQYMTKGLANETFEGSSLAVTGTPAGRNGASNKVPASILNDPSNAFDKGYFQSGYYNNGRRQCQGNTNCTPICPIQAKYDATVTMKKALMTGYVDIIYQAVAHNVILDAGNKGVIGIEYKTYDEVNGPATGGGTATGTTYVIAAHAIEVAKLLLMSNKQLPEGVANHSKQVGRNLMDHPMYLGWGLMPQPTFPFRGPLATSGIEGARDGGFRKDRAAFRIEIGNEGWNWPAGSPYSQLIEMVSPMPSGRPPGQECSMPYEVLPGIFGTELRNNIQQTFTRQFRIGYLIEQLPCEDNYIVPSDKYVDNLGIPRPEIYYDLDEYTMKGFEAAAAATVQMFNTLKVDDKTGVPVGSAGKFTYNNKDYYAQGAGHVMGTHRMGFGKDDSVTNADMQCWDHENLYLVGCGSFPTTATPNPTLTMTALAFKAADAIVAQLNQPK